MGMTTTDASCDTAVLFWHSSQNENDLLAGPSGFRGEAASEGAGEESGDGRASMDVPTPVPPGMLAMRAL